MTPTGNLKQTDRGEGQGRGLAIRLTRCAVVGLLLTDLDEAEPVVERERAVVAGAQVDLEREPRRVGAPLDLVVQRPAEPTALELGCDGDPVEVHEVVVALGEPAVVDAAVVGAGAEDEAEPGDVSSSTRSSRPTPCDGLVDEVGELGRVDRADAGNAALVDGEDAVEIGRREQTDRHRARTYR